MIFGEQKFLCPAKGLIKEVGILRKRTLVLMILLFLFWLVISSQTDIQHILIGAFLAIVIVWFWHDLSPRLPGMLSLKGLLHLGRSILLLAGYIIISNISVAKTLLFSKPPASPVLLFMDPHLKTNWGRVLLATCITITPGTVTIDVNPDTGQFLVHALTEETASDLLRWRIISEIRDLEMQLQRRADHALVSGRTIGPDTPGASESDNRADSH
ncbi:MAG: Na+/H+ antiporter subunit E [Caldicoprobacterales bacterium]|nr:Na+/H+ antiporter subunit E [Clostridiales bacterium]